MPSRLRDSPTHATQLSPGGGWLRLAALAGALALVLAAAQVTGRSDPTPAKQPFDGGPILKLRAERPDIVFIGNSMLQSRLAQTLTRKLAAPKRVSFLEKQGAMSARWYLQLKNHVIASGVRPKRVILFFRGDHLTRPHYRTTGTFAERLQKDAHREEIVLDRVLAGKSRGASLDLGLWARHLPSVSRARRQTQARIDNLGLGLSQWVQPATTHDSRMAEINALFGLEKLRNEAYTPESGTPTSPFYRVLPNSFLPEIIDLARDNRIELLLVRLKERRHTEPWLTSAMGYQYSKDLSAHLEANGVGYIDLRFATWVRAEWFGHGSHIDPRFEKDYTRAFFRNRPEIFE